MLSKGDTYFLTVAKMGSFNKASEKLYVSQPALSKCIQRLEERLGTKLFDRAHSPVRLNDAGQIYYEHLEEELERERVMLEKIEELNKAVRGTLRLGIPSFCGQCFLPQTLPAFSAEFPHVRITLCERAGYELEKALMREEIDIGILHLPLQSGELFYQHLVFERILLAKGREETEAPWKGVRILKGNLSQLHDTLVIMPDEDQKMNTLVRDFFSRINYSPKIYTRCGSVHTMLSLAANGAGVSFTPESGLNAISEAILKRLVFYEYESYFAKWELVFVTRKHGHLNSFQKRFLELFQQTLSSMSLV